MKNKSTRRRSHRSSTSRVKRAGSQIAPSKDLTPLDDPVSSDSPLDPPELQAAGQGQLCFSDKVYLLASVIFQNNHLEKPAAQQLVNYGKGRGIPLPEIKDEEKQRAAYELAFSTFKCKFASDFIYLL